MKSNRKLVVVIIALVVALMLLSSLVAFLSVDRTRFINRAFQNIDRHTFDTVSLVMKEGDSIVYKNINGKEENPLGLNVHSDINQNFKFNHKLVIGKKVQDGDIVKVEGKVENSMEFLGKEVQDLKVSYVVDGAKKVVKSITITYKDQGFDIIISAFAE